jgi:hypothetical protein
MPKFPSTAPKLQTVPENRYRQIMDKVFFDRYRPGDLKIAFNRTDFQAAASQLSIGLPKNLGDIIYSFRFRTSLSDKIVATQPAGLVWRIELAGSGQYQFVLGQDHKILPDPNLPAIDLPDATPAIISKFALVDEQALLAIIRYNRLIDTFLSLTSYSLQNHLRTTVKELGQIEIDELYVGFDRQGNQFVIPVQAKRGKKDHISFVQTDQDMRACAEKFPGTACRSVSVQFLPERKIEMFELTIHDGMVKLLAERHYRLVS